MTLARSIICLFCLASLASAANPQLEKAAGVIREGFPQAAIAPLQELARNSSGPLKTEATLLLARAQLDAGRPGDAIKTLDEYGGRPSDEGMLIRAAALAAQGDLDAAAAIVEPQAKGDTLARILLARILLTRGETEKARALMADTRELPIGHADAARLLLDLRLETGQLDDAEKLIAQARAESLLPPAELDTTLGRIRLAQNRPSEAVELFNSVLATAKLPAPVRDNARLGQARALLALGVDNRARDSLRQVLGESPDAGLMRETMEQWVALEKKLGADPATDLGTWAAEEGTPRAREARLQLAALELERKRPEAAAELLTSLVADESLKPSDAIRARLLLAEARIASGQTSAAIEILDNLPPAPPSQVSRYRLSDLRGRALAATGSHRAAHAAFAAAMAAATTPAETAAAAGNCITSALAAGDTALARESFEALRRADPADPGLVRWSFLLATAEAREGKIDGLAALARRAPSVEYAFLSKLALAEWRLSRSEPAAAERILRTAREEADTPERAATLAAAEIFAADGAGEKPREDLLAACQDFLAKFPAAPEASDVSFKLGELHSRGGDHAAAESVFTDLAAQLPDPEAATLAKFLAAQSASRSMSKEGTERALLWFDEIAQGTSTLRHRARFEQASLLVRDRRFEDALTLYDRILAGEPPPEVRHAALMEKGDVLAAMGNDLPEKLRDAAKVYRALSTDTTAPPDWRDQAACKHAATLARQGQTDEALAAYREVLRRPPGTATDQFWFYKAGLEAARLLETQRDWPAAIAIYDQMASADGPQREELSQRARRLRLEHFIWEN